MPKYKPKPMTRREFHALSVVFDYNFADEQAHWEQTGNPDKHVYNELVVLQDYMDKCNTEESKDA